MISCSTRPGGIKAPVRTREAHRVRRARFISGSYRRLGELSELIRQNSTALTRHSVRRFLVECFSEASSHAQCGEDLNNLERAHLLSIVLGARDLLNKLRRSPRIVRFVPVRLREGSSSEPYMEETVTELLSRHGAMFHCTRPCAKGEILELVRLDTGQKAIVRVVWQKKEVYGHHRVAVEILNHMNFWEPEQTNGAQV